MELTKKSKRVLLNNFNGCGVIFLKTAENEYQVIEFWLNKHNKFYAGNPPKELSEFLYGIIPEIESKN